MSIQDSKHGQVTTDGKIKDPKAVKDVKMDPGVQALLKARMERASIKPNMAKIIVTKNEREQRAKSSTDKTFNGLVSHELASSNLLDQNVALDQANQISKQSQFGGHQNDLNYNSLNLMASSPI